MLRLKRTHCFLAVLCGSLLVMTGAEPCIFYRLSGNTNSFITGLNSSGILSWSNAIKQGSYVVQRTFDLSNELWRPFTRGDFTNQLWSLKVHESSAPEGMRFIPGGTFQMGDSLGD